MTIAANTAGKQPFITLDGGYVCVIHWTGGDQGTPYKEISFRGGNLEGFLKSLKGKMEALRKKLNNLHRCLDVESPVSANNRRIVRQFLGYATWAYAIVCELRPFLEFYKKLPTNFLYVDWVFRLEELYIKCFAAAHMFGSSDESAVGLRGLLTDFTLTGGIKADGSPNNNGLRASEDAYYLAYFGPKNPNNRCDRFADLMEALVKLVRENYPKVREALMLRIKNRIENPTCGFGNPEITSPGKTAMLKRLTALTGGVVS